MSDIRIRRASTDDSLILAQLARRTFLSSYGDRNEPKHIQEYVALAFTPARMSHELADTNSAFFIAEHDAEPIGYAKINLHRSIEQAAGEDAAELERIYVSREYFGYGIGRMLMDAAVAQVSLHGGSIVWLGVWKQNPEAVAFYRKCGFKIVGSKVFMMGREPQEDHLMMLTIKHACDVDAIGQSPG